MPAQGLAVYWLGGQGGVKDGKKHVIDVMCDAASPLSWNGTLNQVSIPVKLKENNKDRDSGSGHCLPMKF